MVQCYQLNPRLFPPSATAALRAIASGVCRRWKDYPSDRLHIIDRVLTNYLVETTTDLDKRGCPYSFPLRISRLLWVFLHLPYSAQVRLHFQAYCLELLTPSDAENAFVSVCMAEWESLIAWIPNPPPSPAVVIFLFA